MPADSFVARLNEQIGHEFAAHQQYAAIALALEQERRVSEQINGLAAAARDAGDYTSEQFMQWFIKEQVEEVATMSDLLRVVERSRDNAMEIENFLAREHGREEAPDPTAPHPAGG